MKLKNIIKNSFFLRSIRLAWSNPGKTGLMALFDISFFVSFYYILPFLASYLAVTILIPLQALSSPMVSFALSALYALLALFVYSFFKYGILDFISSLFKKSDFTFKRLWKFFLLNAVLFIPSFVLFSILLANIKEAYKPYFFVALGIPSSILLYLVVNISHSLFYSGLSLSASISKSLRIVFTNIKSYREAVFSLIIAALALGLLFLGTGRLVSIFVSRDYLLYLRLYGYFTYATIIATYLVAYLVILINRISFYNIVIKNK